MTRKQVKSKAAITLVVVLVGTVVLAGTVTAIVMNSGDDTEEPPQTSLLSDVDEDEEVVVLTHEGGDTLDVTQVIIEGQGLDVDTVELADLLDDTEMIEGDSVRVPVEDVNRFELSVVWEGDDATAELFRMAV